MSSEIIDFLEDKLLLLRFLIFMECNDGVIVAFDVM